ncbi:MAG: hypothetical protein M0R17_06075 [Candidatus Omnitrophica bacterium]|nr:hypothetical protein [Candidatus Omnitrophota bacterium]
MKKIKSELCKVRYRLDNPLNIRIYNQILKKERKEKEEELLGGILE